MSKKKICFIFVFFVFIFCFKIASASVIINEFMSHPNSGEKEWVEILNTSGNPVDLTGWKITELSSPGTNPVENDVFLTGTINSIFVFEFGTSKLNDSGDSIGLYDNLGNLVNRVTFGTGSTVIGYSLDLGSSLIGKSGALVSGVWLNNQEPTKNLLNPTSDNNENNNNTEGSDGGTTTSSSGSSNFSSSTPKPKIIPTFKANILAPTLAFAGQPIEFNLNIKYGDDIYACGKYFWNFGDGDSKKVEGGFEKFTHTFYYPGEYNVSLEYFEKKDSALPAITDDMIIKVVPMTVSISNVGDYKDFFIEISNNANSKINISNWILSSDNRSFVLPKNTVVAGNNSTIISGKISGFTIADKSSLKLSMPDGEVVFDYNSKSVPIKRVESESYENYSNNENEEYGEENNNSNFYENQADSKNKKDLASASILSGQGNILSKYGFILSLLVLLCFSAGVVYFIRRKNHNVVSNTDFDVIDE